MAWDTRIMKAMTAPPSAAPHSQAGDGAFLRRQGDFHGQVPRSRCRHSLPLPAPRTRKAPRNARLCHRCGSVGARHGMPRMHRCATPWENDEGRSDTRIGDVNWPVGGLWLPSRNRTSPVDPRRKRRTHARRRHLRQIRRRLLQPIAASPVAASSMLSGSGMSKACTSDNE